LQKFKTLITHFYKKKTKNSFKRLLSICRPVQGWRPMLDDEVYASDNCWIILRFVVWQHKSWPLGLLHPCVSRWVYWFISDDAIFVACVVW